jgi:hypothetical protein
MNERAGNALSNRGPEAFGIQYGTPPGFRSSADEMLRK